MHIIGLYSGCLFHSDMQENAWPVLYVLLVYLKCRTSSGVWAVKPKAKQITQGGKSLVLPTPLEADVTLHSLAHALTRLWFIAKQGCIHLTVASVTAQLCASLRKIPLNNKVAPREKQKNKKKTVLLLVFWISEDGELFQVRNFISQSLKQVHVLFHLCIHRQRKCIL